MKYAYHAADGFDRIHPAGTEPGHFHVSAALYYGPAEPSDLDAYGHRHRLFAATERQRSGEPEDVCRHCLEPFEGAHVYIDESSSGEDRTKTVDYRHRLVCRRALEALPEYEPIGG